MSTLRKRFNSNRRLLYLNRELREVRFDCKQSVFESARQSPRVRDDALGFFFFTWILYRGNFLKSTRKQSEFYCVLLFNLMPPTTSYDKIAMINFLFQ